MRDYGIVAPTFWTRGTGRSIRGDHVTQLVAVYLMTAPGANMAGVFNVSAAQISNDIGASVEDVERAIVRLHENEGPSEGGPQGPRKALRRGITEGRGGFGSGFLVWSNLEDMVFVRTMCRRQLGIEKGECLKPKDNRITHIVRLVKQCSDPLILQAFHDEYRKTLHLPKPWWTGDDEEGPSEGGPQGPRKALRRVLGSQDQDQDQDQKEREGKPHASELIPSQPEPDDTVSTEEPSPPLSLASPSKTQKQTQTKALKPKSALTIKRFMPLAWETFHAAHERHHGAYVEVEGDKGAMAKVASRVRIDLGKAIEAGKVTDDGNGSVEAAAKRWLDVFWKRYMENPGLNDRLNHLGHPVRSAPGDLNGFGGVEW